jgi:hypothetical protein
MRRLTTFKELSGIFTAMLPTIAHVIRSASWVITRLMEKKLV